MKVEELVDFANWENGRVEMLTGKGNEEMKSFSVLKIGEEYGEFINEFLKLNKLHRKEKMSNPKNVEKDMAEELVDVILTTFLAGRRLGIDIETELFRKIEKVRGRDY